MDKGLTLTFVGVDVGLGWERAQATFCQRFVYKTNDEVDSMSIEDLRAYAKECRDTSFDILSHEITSIGEVCIYILNTF